MHVVHVPLKSSKKTSCKIKKKIGENVTIFEKQSLYQPTTFYSRVK